jgi:CubicO group peptidase (beta-lactamase class C family)
MPKLSFHLLFALCLPALVSRAAPPASAEARMAKVTSSLVPVVRVRGAPPVRRSLAERMRSDHLPGVSIAFAEGGRVVWARGFGVRRAGAADPVSPTTPFEAASIGKVIAATASLKLVDQGKLSLDEDVNRALRSWKVPDSRFTAKEKVTLRRLLSHTAGVTGHSVESYAESEPLPTMLQVLDGQKPAKGDPIRVDAVPGTIARYSGGGVTIEELLLTDVTGTSFPELADQLVLAPMGMRHSSFARPLPAALEREVALPHDTAGQPLPRQRYVQMAAAGLWSTPSDLLAWALDVAAAARAGSGSHVLSPATAKRMITVEKGLFGLGPIIQGEGRAVHFGHQGWNGGFHSEVIYFPELGQGAAVMLNGDGGRPLVREILYTIAAEYGWPDFEPSTISAVAVDEAALDRVVGTYEVAKPVKLRATVSREGQRLFLDAPVFGVRTELVFTAPAEVTALETGEGFAIELDPAGRVTALQFGFLKLPRRPTP